MLRGTSKNENIFYLIITPVFAEYYSVTERVVVSLTVAEAGGLPWLSADDKGKPAVRQGRKATGLSLIIAPRKKLPEGAQQAMGKMAGLPNGRTSKNRNEVSRLWITGAAYSSPVSPSSSGSADARLHWSARMMRAFRSRFQADGHRPPSQSKMAYRAKDRDAKLRAFLTKIIVEWQPSHRTAAITRER